LVRPSQSRFKAYLQKNLRKTKSFVNSQNVKKDIIQVSKKVDHVEQYQIDEFLDEPYRRIVVRHFKLVYVPDGDLSIIVLQVFDTYSQINIK